MKLLLTMNLPYFPAVGGANKANRSLAEEFVRRGHTVQVVVPALGTPSQLTQAQFLDALAAEKIQATSQAGVTIFQLNGVEVHAVAEAAHLNTHLTEQLHAFKPDWALVSSEDPSQRLLEIALQACPDRVAYLVHTAVFLPFGPQSFFPSPRRAKLFGQIRVMVAVSAFVQDYIRQWSGLDSTLVYMPVYGPGPFPYLGNFQNDFVTLVNPCAIKGISIFEGLARALPEINFAAVPTWGTTPADRVRLARLPNVQLLEPCADFDRILARTRVTLVPSLSIENFSLTAVESMLRGIPVLGSRVGGIPEAKLGTDFLLPVQPIERFTDQLDENHLPIPIVPEQDLQPWREALAQLLSDRTIYEHHSQVARAAAEQFVSGLSLTPLEDLLIRLSTETRTGPAAMLDQSGVAESTPEAESSLGRAANLTPEQRALLMLKLRKKSSGVAKGEGQPSHIPVAAREGDLPLSFAQQRLWFLDQINPNSPVYNLFDALRLTGPLNLSALERSFNALIQRHEILRTTFPSVKGQPIQQIAPAQAIELRLVDLSHFPEAERDRQTEVFIKAETHQPFDLAHGPLLRVHLLRLTDDDHLLLLTFHHIIADGWSTGILLRELAAFYESFSTGVSRNPLPELPIQYVDYALWERDWLEKEGHLEEHLAYWKRHLADEPLQLDLPLARPRPPVQTYDGATHPLKFSASVRQALLQISQQEGATLFMTVLAAFQAFLHRYTGQTDISIGTPVAGRTRAEVEGLIGFFVNTLVMRTQVSGDLSFREVVGQVRETALNAYAHQEVPFEKIVEALQLERDLSRSPLFQVMFLLDKAWTPQTFSGLASQWVALQNRTAKFDLTLTLVEGEQGLKGDLRYNIDLFDADTIARMAAHFKNFLERAVTQPDVPLSALPLLAETERRQMLVEWNATQVAYPPARCIHELFEDQVKRTPTAPALRYEGQTLSYQELNERANHLAQYLRHLGVGPDVRVGICLERSLEMVIGLLGSLKAGGAYVPLDPSYPEERLAYMLEDARIEVLVTNSLGLGAGDWGLGTPARQPVRVCLDAEWETITKPSSLVPNPPPPTPDSLIYIIYTSGSTGKPKGAMNSHRGLYNRLLWMQEAYHLTADDHVLQKTPFSFDVSGWEFFWPLITGALLVLARPNGHQDPSYLAQLIIEEQITTLHFVPSMLQLFLEEPKVTECHSLKRVICSGEALPVEVQNRFFARLTAELHNLYGPTEAAIDVTYWACSPDPERHSVPIGRPIANTQMYILDAQLQPVPIGVPGELYIGGVGLGRGYFQRPELTAERFIPNPFVGEVDGRKTEDRFARRTKDSHRPPSSVLRLYKTGDLARYLPDGNIEFLGRLDHQVKIRGFRIELGEIEAALARHLAVREVVVVARETGRARGDKQLVAYLSLHTSETVTTSDLRSFLQKTLPDYMLPSVFVFLDALPLNPNGKVDRRQLPDPGTARPDLEKAYVPPQTPVEEILAGVWSELLKIERVGREDNFFELGGHSLLATQVISRLREAFQIELPLRRLFELPILSDFANAVEAERQSGAVLRVAPLTRIPREVGAMHASPLSFAQQRLWFLDQLEPGNSAYHMPNVFRLSGSLNVDALERGLNAIIERHESLRTTFSAREEQPVQVILPELRLALPVVDLRSFSVETREAEARRLGIEEIVRPFDLAHGPLIRARLFGLGEDEHILIITLHHIVSDGWSLGLFWRELSALYTAFSQDQSPSLPELPIQYADFAHWQRHYLQGQAFEQQLAYWREQLTGAPPMLELPNAQPRPAAQSFRGGKDKLVLSPALSEALIHLSRREGLTLFMTLLAAFQALLARYSGQADVVVGTPIAGRTRAETEALIGCFLNTLVLRTDLREAGNPTFRELLSRVRVVALGAYAHQDLPFEHLLEELQPVRDLSRTPVFQVLFNMLNLDSEPLRLAGLRLERLSLREDGEAKFDLTLYAGEVNGLIDFTLVYNADLFEAPRMAELLEHFHHLLEAVAANPELRVAELPLTPPSVRTPPVPVADRIPSVEDFTDFSLIEIEQTIPARFEAQVQRNPERLALKTAKYSLSYAELNAAANQVAHAILARRGDVEERTALLFDHDAPMIIGLLGALKAGKTYVPLDPTYPPDRLTYMVQDSQANLIVTDEDHLPLATTLAPTGVEILTLEDIGATITSHASPSTLHSPLSFSPDRLAYLLYTSGSTGQPKGVMQNHRNVLHHIRAYTNNLRISATDRLTLFSSYSFDAAVMDIFGALLNGATLYPYPIKVAGIDGLSDWLLREEITIYHSTPTVFRYFVETLGQGTKDERPRTKDEEKHSSFVLRPSSSAFPALRLLVLGGEEAQRRDAEAFQRHFGPACRLINGLGPTESTVSLQYVIDHQTQIERPSLPVGHPVDQTEVLLLTEVGEQTAVYGLGEIALRSPYVALGYWRQEELTAEKFMTMDGRRKTEDNRPPSAVHRLYKTGDLGRYLPDGSLEFVGRRDFQVKVRGYRVEIGEIETRLLRLPGVKAAVVVAQQTPRGESQLVAYVVPAPEAVLAADEIRRELAEQLPDYMIPVACLLLEALPLTPTGKVDRRALPKVEQGESGDADAYRAPRNPVEDLLAGIYAELLGLERVGVEDDFFLLGGHSLLATRVISRIRALLGVELPLRTLFESPTITGLAEHIARAQATDMGVVVPPLRPVSREIELPLSFSQQRLWFLDQLEPGNPSYHLLSALRLTGSLDVEKLERAFERVIQRHESLRTTFPILDGQPMQRINPAFNVAIPITELPNLSEAEQVAKVEQLIRDELHRPFDLAEGPLLHIRLLRLSNTSLEARVLAGVASDRADAVEEQGETEHVLILVFHHIISDAWSIGLFIREASEFYADEGMQKPELSIHYADYAAWEREWLAPGGEALERQLNYWKQQLAGAPPLLKLPTDYPRPPIQSSRGARQALTISPELTTKLKALGRQTGATLYMTLLAAFQTLLARYSGQTDVVIGSSIASRQQAEVEGLIGCFVNTLTLRGDLSGNPTFRELLSRTRETALGAFAHQELPFEQLVDGLQLGRNLSQNPIFQVMFVLQNAPRFAISLPGLTLQPIGIESGTAQFDLTLYLWETATGMGGGLEYSTDLFEAATVTRLIEHFQLLLASVVENPDLPLWNVPLLTETEHRQLLTEWNVTRAEYPRGLCLHQLFEAQAARTPDATAVCLLSPIGEIKLTYAELNEKANQLAQYLRQLGVGPESFVGLCVERSPEMAIGLLGILKAGGAYVPLDPAYPTERLAFMIADSDVRIVLTKSRWLDEVKGAGGLGLGASEQLLSTICLDTDWDSITKSQSPVPNIQSPAPSPQPLAPAYIIYTSGSTGTPKGVVIQHSGLINHSYAIRENFNLQPNDRVLQFASISFDVAAEEFYPTWLSGAAVVFRPDQLGSYEEFQQFVAQAGVTVLNLPTPFWQEWVLEILRQPSTALPECLRLVIIGNEKGLPERVESWQALTGGRIQLKAAYGPTEATITTTVYDPPDITPGAVTVPIGRPLPNVEVYLLDPHLQPVPIGMPGEVYVGGVGLARGYLNRPDLTAEKFVPNPFVKDQGQRAKGQDSLTFDLGPWPLRLYRTGDLARYLPNGNIEFLGRVDHQVKIRGFRIELGEIEIALGQHPAVRQAVVAAREDVPGDVYLAAYLVADQSPTPVSELREMLKSRLPDYMIPSAFVWLNAMPLLPNGKLDRAALPAPEAALMESGVEFVAPRTYAEQVLAGIWSEVLRRERIGIHDNFFDLGGHSLLATQVISRVRDTFQIELPLRTLFESSTLEDLAQSIDAILQTGAKLNVPPLRAASREVGANGRSPLPLSFAQQRLWFLDQFEPNSSVYNIPSAYRLTGPLDVSALERAFNAILERHEILRTTFAVEDDLPLQVIAPVAWRSLHVEDLSALPPDEREAEARRWMKDDALQPFSLTQGPLLRLTLLRLEPEVYAFLFNIHHIITDGWSLDIFWEELTTFYNGFIADQSERTLSGGLNAVKPVVEGPSALSLQYADFAAWQRNWLQGEVLETQLAYWKRHLADAPPVLELPTDRPRPATQTFHGARQPIALSKAASEALKALSEREGVTLFMTLIAAFQTLLARYTRQEDIVIGSPIAGRNQAETERMMGFFVNTLVLRTDLSGNPTFQELLQRVREVALEAYTHQDVPFEKLVEELQPERKLSHSPLFQALFVLQNESEGDWKFSNLNLRPWGVQRETVMFDLTLDLLYKPEGLRGQFGYNTDLFDAATIARMAEHFQILLEGIAAHPAKHLADLPLLTGAETQKLLTEWNATRVAYPAVQCLHELFEAQVERTPDAPAIIFDAVGTKHSLNFANASSLRMTYRELNARANQLAHYLQSLGVGPEVTVGLYLERSLNFIVALLGVLKAGGAYVPLDTSYPEERLAYMIEDARIKVLVTQERLLAAGRSWLVASEKPLAIVCLDTDWESIVASSQTPATSRQQPATENLAYLIYTSGSTGQPKGVAVEHRQIFNYLQSILERLDLPPGASYATVSTFAADLGNTVVFPSLVTGGCLHIISQERAADPEALVDYFTRHPIDCLKIVPSHLGALLNASRPEQVLPRKRLVLGGEASRSEWVANLTTLAPDCAILNHYGPTETTIGVLTHAVQPDSLASAPAILPLGRPLNNIQIYILDAHLNPVPLGVPGELYIGGEGLTRGYLGRPELTAERFVPNPFVEITDERRKTKDEGEPSSLRLYKTGDLARYLPNGNIEFLGRVDHQVKIRGFRIELPEIEARLRDHPEVQEAVVLKREDTPGDPRLVAYVVPVPERVPAVNGRRRYRLPNNLGVVQLNKNETDYIYREIFELQAYLRHGITLNDGDCIFDVGANIGLFTLFTHQMCRSPRVYSFEPNPTVAQILRANAALHAPGTNVFECGVSSENKTAEFTFFSGFSLLSGFYADAATEKQVVKNFMQNQQQQGMEDMRELVEQADELLEERFAVNTFTTQLKTLSTLIRELGIERIDLLKINVEKSEFDVLRGIEDQDWNKIAQIVLEVDLREHLDSIVQLLEGHGYELYVEQDILLQNTQLCYIYAIRPSADRQLIREQALGEQVRPIPLLPEPFLTSAELRNFLSPQVPDYMVPSAFVMLEALPLNANGKLDRRALSTLSLSKGEGRQTTFAPPRTPVEEKVAEIWRELLRVERIGLQDNFFELGGHSLLATQAISRVRKAFQVELPVRSLFEAPTLAALSERIMQTEMEQADSDLLARMLAELGMVS